MNSPRRATFLAHFTELSPSIHGAVLGRRTTSSTTQAAVAARWTIGSQEKVCRAQGVLWAFVSDTPGVRNYYDVIPGSGTEVKGHFIKVPKDIATGRKVDGSELTSADKNYPPPPANGSWRTFAPYRLVERIGGFRYTGLGACDGKHKGHRHRHGKGCPGQGR